MELTLGLQLFEPVPTAISVRLDNCQRPLRVITGLLRLQRLQGVSLTFHSPTVIRAHSPHARQDTGVDKRMFTRNRPWRSIDTRRFSDDTAKRNCRAMKLTVGRQSRTKSMRRRRRTDDLRKITPNTTPKRDQIARSVPRPVVGRPASSTTLKPIEADSSPTVTIAV